MPLGLAIYLLFKGEQMNNMQRYNAANLEQLFDRINKNSIGMGDYFDALFKVSQENYPPYNLVQLNNEESRLEVALAGFKKEEINVYTEYGKLFVEGKKKKKEENDYIIKGLAQRDFSRSWSISDDTEVRSVIFEDGLLIVNMGKIVPDHHQRKDWI